MALWLNLFVVMSPVGLKLPFAGSKISAVASSVVEGPPPTGTSPPVMSTRPSGSGAAACRLRAAPIDPVGANV
jgi:hypothetical protein